MAGKNKTIFITGANGFIGANLTRFLAKKNFKVHILVRNKSDLWRLNGIVRTIKIHEADVTNNLKLKKIIKKIKPDYIIHLASYGNSSTEIDFNKIVNINVMGLINLFNASESTNYKKLIVCGSSSEYGFKNKPMAEIDYLLPNSYYSAAKGAASLLAQGYAIKNSKPIVIIRPFSVYGPFEEKNRFIPTIIKKALKNEKILVTKESVKRDFVFIDDLVSAFHKTLTTPLNPGEIINIGTGKQYSNKEIVKKIEKILKLKLKLGTFPKRAWDTDNWVANNQKARKVLKWNPKYSIDQGLKKTIEWHIKYSL
nr:NAD(P)-dependent oxidoreductase [Candidatus Levybacteria bacterium]